MLKELLEENINVAPEASSWQDAVKLAAEPLLKNRYIEARYIDSIIRNINENGPYIVLMPGFAMPHSRPEEGVIKTGLSLLKLQKSVIFPEDKEVSLLITLAANDSDMHLELISELTEIMTDDAIMERLFAANSKEEILACL